MEWIEGKISRSSFVDFNVTLYRINDDIYDEIIFKNKEYYLIRRCGVETYRYNHKREIFITDNKILVYPLEEHEIYEQKLELDTLKSFNEITAISLINGEYISSNFTLDIDKRYIEYVDTYVGNNLVLDMSKYDDSRDSYIYSIKNMLPHELIDNNSIVSNYTTAPNIIINGHSEQEVIYDNKSNLLSPTFENPSKIKSFGKSNKTGNYNVDVETMTNDSLSDNSWNCKMYRSSVYNDDNIFININDPSVAEVVVSDIFVTELRERKFYDFYANGTIGFGLGYVYLSTYLYCDKDTAFTTHTFIGSNKGVGIRLNNELIYNKNDRINSNFTYNFKKGWNYLEYYCPFHYNYNTIYMTDSLSEQDFVLKMCNELPIYEKFNAISLPKQLLSLDNIKDFAFRDVDNIWKIKSYIGKYTFTGNEAWKINALNEKLNEFIFESDLFNVTKSSVNVISEKLLGVVSATNAYEISLSGNKLRCILPATSFLDVMSLQNYCKDNELIIYYVLSEPIINNIDDPLDLNSLTREIVKKRYSNLYIKDFEEYNLLEIDYTTSITCSTYNTLISVESNKTYIFNRPKSGDVCYFEYYDKNKNIVGTSGYLDTNATSFEFSVPDDIYYVLFFDGVNSTENTYSLMESNDYGVGNTTITQLHLTVNGKTTILPLPHELNPGDELEFDIDRNRWTYYPLSIDEDFIYYDDVIFKSILLNKTDVNIACQVGLYLTAAISNINIRELTYPVNVQVIDEIYTGNNGYGYITWDELAGATEYAIYVDDELIASIDASGFGTQEYHCISEQQGNVTIMGYNDFNTSGYSDVHEICTVPNSPVLEYVDTVYENNRYYVTIKFTANSTIADVYEIIYSIDGSNNNVVSFDHDKTYGKEMIYTFNAAAISNNMKIQLTSTNSTGRNDYIAPTTLVTNDGFSVWTYKTSMQEVLLGWIDNFTDEISYSLKYSVNKEEWQTLMVDGKAGSGDRLLEYIPLSHDDEMRICIAVVRDGYVNIYTRPITVSKALDKTLIPPANFTGTKVDSGQIQFTWDDVYDVDANFELYYQYSDGTSQTIYIPKESSTTGDYTYVHNVDVYGFITARLRMVWELGESEYTENIIVYNIPVVTKAPTLLPKQRENNKLKISWETYEFVQNYILYFTVDGIQTVIEQVDSEYLWDIPYDKESISISAAVKALFIDGTYTNISESLSFNICNNDNFVHSLIYTHHEFDEEVYTVVGSKGLETPYPINTLSMNSYSSLYDLIEKIYSSYLFTEYNLIENYWGHNVGDSYPVWTLQKSSYKFDYPLVETIYSKVSTDNNVETIVYVPTTTEYPLYSEFVKIAIATLGDSITAGHPNYWAETGTGDITSQYQYWLDKRLKGEFNVINKGYGQEKTIDMLERFERDILPLDARYCIILGGTNDWYQDASTKDLDTGYTVMDGAIENITEIVKKCWDNGIYPIICTLTPRNDINENGKVLFDYFNNWVKTYSTEQSISGKECAYIDMFNAGKNFDPPEPLEDPNNPYKLNPLFDGDNIFDENGVQIKSGLGVHMNAEGYRVMGYAIPLTLFKTADSGLKIYRDAECTQEEYFNTTEASNPYYEITVTNVRRGTPKNIIKYLKNIGTAQTLYYVYVTDAYNMNYYFIDDNGNHTQTLTGIQSPSMSKQLNLVIESEFDDYISDFKIHIVSRDLTVS